MTRTPIRDVPDIIDFVTDRQLLGLTISLAQRTLLKSIYGIALTDEELEMFRACTGRATYPAHAFPEATIIAGARAGKDSRIAAPCTLYEAIFGQHERHLSRGETATIPLIAQDTRGAGVAFGYIRDYLQGSPLLATKLADEPLTSSLTLTNGVVIACFPCTLKSMRGFSIPCGVLDELGFFRIEGSADSDAEIQASVRRGMISFPNTRLLKISTPYMKGGVLYSDFKRAWGADDDDILVWKASSLLMNPSLRAERLERERRLDPSRYAREYEAQFVDDLESFLSSAWIEAAIMRGRHALAPQPDKFWYIGAVDASGGVGKDAFTASVVHFEGAGAELRIVQDYVHGYSKSRSGPVDLEGTVAEIARTLASYGITVALSDSYAPGWVRQAFERNGITLEDAPTKSEAYLEMEAPLSQGRLAILDHPQQTRELGLLERRNRPGGKPSIDAPRGTPEDHANALALAVYGALQAAQPTVDTSMTDEEYATLRRISMHPGEFYGFPEGDIGGNFLEKF
jgi:hypothetical protein